MRGFRPNRTSQKESPALANRDNRSAAIVPAWSQPTASRCCFHQSQQLGKPDKQSHHVSAQFRSRLQRDCSAEISIAAKLISIPSVFLYFLSGVLFPQRPLLLNGTVTNPEKQPRNSRLFSFVD
jgi:hypothetical protein